MSSRDKHLQIAAAFHALMHGVLFPAAAVCIAAVSYAAQHVHAAQKTAG